MKRGRTAKGRNIQRSPEGSGSVTRKVVPPPRGLCKSIRPPRASTRSFSPKRPVPPENSAPPTPSSATFTRNAPSICSTSALTVITDAPECLAALVNASATM